MHGTNIFPVPNPTTPYWRSELHEIDRHRTTETLPSECDVLIIGAGLSGVSTAYHLLNDNANPPSVVLLEAREICSGATARNGGHAMMVHGYIEPMIQRHGVEVAKELALFESDVVYAMKAAVEKEKLDCDFVMTRVFEVSLTQALADEQKKVYERQVAAGLDFIRDVQFVDGKNVEILSGVKNAKGGITTMACQLWPYKFVTGLLARLLERTSINVQSRTLVTSVSTTKDGNSIVNTARGSILAHKVVFATNAYTSALIPNFAQRIVPLKGTCSHISTPKDAEHPPPHLTHTYGISFGPMRDYLVPRPDGGIIVGGAKDTFVKDEKAWFDNFDDSTLIEPARKHFEAVMQDNFIGWAKSGAAVDYLWTGIMGKTIDHFPHCGNVLGQKNRYILAGFNGAGMSHIFLTGKGIAKMVLEDVPFEQSGIPRIFKTTEERMKNKLLSAGQQDVDGDVQTSLGPFACPVEYYVASTSIQGASTFTACCASGYTFDGVVNFGNAQQCTSTIPAGETLSYTFPSSEGFTTTNVKLAQQAVMTAVQINGWNFGTVSSSVTTTAGVGGDISFNPTDFTLASTTTTSSSSSSSSSQASSSTTSNPSSQTNTASSSSSTSTPTSSSGLSSGATIAIAVSCSVLALTAICLIALLLVRRRRNARPFQQLSAPPPQFQLYPPDIAPSQESKIRAAAMGGSPSAGLPIGKTNYHALYEVGGEGRPHEMYSPGAGTLKSSSSTRRHHEAYELDGMDAQTPGARSVGSHVDRSPAEGTEKVLTSEATRYMR
ncbi:hypothetical protein B7494_g6052 [Chlorociboria aeruginascens]|nr:hypothetical protein B7494_g6052 [Chlorociboria aeruginascens]